MKTLTPRQLLGRYVLSALFGMVGAIITVGVILLLDKVTRLVWESGIGIDVDNPTRTWVIPLLILAAGTLVSLFYRKRKEKLNGLDQVLEQILSKGPTNWREMPQVLLMALLSIGSGASLGPEAPSAFLSAGVASMAAEKVKQKPEVAQVMTISSAGGMLGGLLNSPFLLPAMIAEGAAEKIRQARNILTYSMVASAFGTSTFFMLYHKLFIINIGLPTYGGTKPEGLLAAFGFGLFGAIMGLVVFLLSQKVTKPLIAKIPGQPWVKTMVLALVVGLIAFALPLTMFSGQHTLPALINKASEMSFVLLVIIGVAKLISTNLLLEAGFYGGAIFPALFAGAAFGLALNHFIGASAALAVPAAVAGLMTLLQQKPLTAAFITITISGITTAAEVAIAVAGAMIVVLLVQQMKERHATSRSADA